MGFSLGQFVLEGLLSLRQYKVLQNKKAPKTLEDEISQDVFDQSQVTKHFLLLMHGSHILIFLHRHTVAPKQSLASSPACTPRSRMSSSSSTTSCLNCGL